jgi:pimeloyl-ACP methyl ester carboxylesterase
LRVKLFRAKRNGSGDTFANFHGVRALQDIVFVPGLNCTAELFKPQIEALSGIARSHVADHGVADSLEAIAEDVLAKAPARFILAGLSMGGYVAFEMLRQAPERVRALVLLDTRAAMDTPEDADRRRQTIKLAESGAFERLHDILWPRLVHADRHKDTALEAIVKRMMDETGPERFIRQQTAVLNRIDYLPTLASAKLPALVITGAADVITPPESGRALASAIEGAVFREIPACGHLSTLEQPEDVNILILDFVRNLQ